MIAGALQEQPASQTDVVGSLLRLLAAVGRRLTPTERNRPLLPERLRCCRQAIEDDLARPWSLPELAALADRDPSWLTRAWRRHLDSSPIAWLGRRRCERAAVGLLTSDQAIAAIGRNVGYDDANYFARRFRRNFGQSPRSYRAGLPLPAAAATSTADRIQW